MRYIVMLIASTAASVLLGMTHIAGFEPFSMMMLGYFIGFVQAVIILGGCWLDQAA